MQPCYVASATFWVFIPTNWKIDEGTRIFADEDLLILVSNSKQFPSWIIETYEADSELYESVCVCSIYVQMSSSFAVRKGPHVFW